METNKKTKTAMSAAGRKRKQRAKSLAKITEEEKKSHREKENKQRSDLRKVQLKKMSEEERSSFRTEKVARVRAYKNSKIDKSMPSTPAVSKNSKTL